MANAGAQMELSRRSGLSPGSVSDMIRELEQAGLVRIERRGRSTLVQMAPTAGAAVGVELGFHLTQVVARRVDQDYSEARVRTVPVGAVAGARRWVPEVVEAIHDAVSDLAEEEIAAVGLAVPRMVDPRSGKLTPPALPPWDEDDDPAGNLADGLRQPAHKPRFLAPVVVMDNDANLAAYGESFYGFPDAETVVAIKASTGIGAGLIVGGQIFRGRRGVAGEIGHVVVQPGGPFCSCGGRGCLEALIGADALVEQARTVLGQRRLASPGTLEDLIAMANNGNPTCQRVLQEAGRTLGATIGNLCNILNPDVVVLDGALGSPDAVKFTLPSCEQGISQTAMEAALGEGFTLQPGRVPQAAAHGALILGLEGTRYYPSRD